MGLRLDRRPSELTFGERLMVIYICGIANRFNVGEVEVDRVDRFVMERAQIKAILAKGQPSCKSKARVLGKSVLYRRA
jgi:hypothetical protein